MFERFTRAARDVVVRAQLEALEARARHLGTEHLLLALLDPAAGPAHDVLVEAGLTAPRVREGMARLAAARPGPEPAPGAVLGPEDAAALRQVGIDLEEVLRRMEESFGADALRSVPETRRRGLLRRRSTPSPRPTPRARKVIELSLRETLALGHRHIGSEHLLLGLLREGTGLGTQVLADCGADVAALRTAVLQRLSTAA